LRLQYHDQPEGEWLFIAMEPIKKDSGGDPFLFRLDRGGYDRWLVARYGGPDRSWGADCRFVFVRRK